MLKGMSTNGHHCPPGQPKVLQRERLPNAFTITVLAINASISELGLSSPKSRGTQNEFRDTCKLATHLEQGVLLATLLLGSAISSCPSPAPSWKKLQLAPVCNNGGSQGTYKMNRRISSGHIQENEKEKEKIVIAKRQCVPVYQWGDIERCLILIT